MTMTIGMLAQASSVTIDTIRYYERLGLIMPDAGPKQDQGQAK